MCIYVHICIHVCTVAEHGRVSLSGCIHLSFLHVCMGACLHVHVHIYTLMLICMCVYFFLHVCMYIYGCLCIYICTCIYMYICVYIYALAVAVKVQCVAMCCSVLQCVAVSCIVLQSVAVCCSVLWCVAVSCSLLQLVAACCSALQCVILCVRALIRSHASKQLGRVAACCNVCCSVYVLITIHVTHINESCHTQLRGRHELYMHSRSSIRPHRTTQTQQLQSPIAQTGMLNHGSHVVTY